jgi:hypothetical protein
MKRLSLAPVDASWAGPATRASLARRIEDWWASE